MSLRTGVVFPHPAIGADLGALRGYAQAVAELGFTHVLTYDHVVGADPRAYRGWTGPYDIGDPFHEPMVLLGFLAGIIELELVTGVVILPQRQTVLVAKQAAEVDVLSGGRLRIGIGLGWNPVEYQALGMNFGDRGRRVEEQVTLLRRLWTEPAVTFQGADHHLEAAGLNPLPVQRPIPLWMGAGAPRAERSKRALRRVGRIADGWIAMGPPGPELQRAAATVHEAARDAGRDPDQLGIEGRIEVGDGDLDRIAREHDAWLRLGATHVSLGTMRSGLTHVDQHIEALRKAKAVSEH